MNTKSKISPKTKKNDKHFSYRFIKEYLKSNNPKDKKFNRLKTHIKNCEKCRETASKIQKIKKIETEGILGVRLNQDFPIGF